MNGTPKAPEVEWTPQNVARVWDFYGANAACLGAFFSHRHRRHIWSVINQHLPMRRRHVLDYGCGPGFILEELARHNVTCSGLEFSVKAAEAATERLRGYASFNGVVVVESLPSRLESGSFDTVLCIEVVEHLTDEQLLLTLREVYRLIRPGGAIYLSTPNQENLDQEKVMCPNCGSIFHRWQHVRSWSPASLVAAMEDHGFTTRLVREMLFVQKPRSLMGFAQRVHSIVGHYRPHLVYIGVK